MTDARVRRVEQLLERLGARLDPDDLSGVDIGPRFVYTTLPDWIELDEGRASLGDEWTTELVGTGGVAYDVPTFGVTVYVFDASIVACMDSTDRDLAAAAIAATVTELAATPVEPSTDLDLREVSLTADPDDEWSTTRPETFAADRERADADDTERESTAGVTPSPCSGCGRVPDGWERYCPRCGTDLKPASCHACEAPLAEWMLYCPACGRDTTGSV